MDDPLISYLFLHSFAQTHQVDDPLISLFLHSFAQTHQIDDPLISLVPPFICSNSPSRRPSDIPCSSIHLLKLTKWRRYPYNPHSFAQTQRPSDILVPPFICSDRRPSDIPCSSIHLLKLTKRPLISLVPPFICSNSPIPLFPPFRQPSDILLFPPFICSNSPNGRPSDIPCSSIHLLKLTKQPSDILVPPFICSNSPSRRPSDIPCSSIHLLQTHQIDNPLISLFLHSFAQTHQVDDPLISLVPPFIC
ncbi:unnamed protein product [Acanthosepion pharaonis]|uniref:Uncharacterized protein n=1 Tax=Acanthosepion pharaonis TaxID=158019 RepID=A0A812BAL2_ACAPH|nr:unnamed protein product [Sepia pharaonis]